jgi:hypothetical protein
MVIKQKACIIWTVKREIQKLKFFIKQTSVESPYSSRVFNADKYFIKPAIKNYMSCLIYKFILNTNKRYLVFITSNFVLNMIFSSMLSIFEFCQQYHDTCLVYIREISECYISGITQDLEFIFRVPIKNAITKNSQDKKGT